MLWTWTKYDSCRSHDPFDRTAQNNVILPPLAERLRAQTVVGSSYCTIHPVHESDLGPYEGKGTSCTHTHTHTHTHTMDVCRFTKMCVDMHKHTHNAKRYGFMHSHKHTLSPLMED